MSSEKYQRGLKRLQELDPKAEESLAILQRIVPGLAEAIVEYEFADIYTRPGLDLKTRALICVISDAAQGRDPELKLHLRFARNQGWTEDELSEALLHLAGYVGAPLVREALLTAIEVFKEMAAE